ncbi:voltage-gated potassium channel [Chromohalobacter marismortui]|uniref:Voltage-gated potassium channel n=1 Tax=Chromohalobacter marismortui TaxID=42055 RepID=A0A4R7NSR3_9GAMM|nr:MULTISPECIES: ion transporter [Chromohalobacter]MCI0509189.1 ion transporter [Chromohalobacter sp.]MCI0593880.1 ion transporter [Chromohalobacter sp.]TDU23918.1 voltage-gated potassium channel [Chromohalobacter marismortui]
MTLPFEPADTGLRKTLFHIIFESDTRAAKIFDILLITLILLSVAVVFVDSVPSLHARFGGVFYLLEWGFTLLFTLELAVRLYCLERPLRYLKSFYGIVDLLSILPTWLSLLIPGAQTLLVVRVLRALRVFRVLRLMEFVGEGRMLTQALARSYRKVMLFLFTVLLIITIFGALIYVIEPPEAGFTSMPRAMYWAIVTLTTVGYGDITPITPLGQFISACMMILGYSIIAVPTGVFSAEVIRSIHAERYSEEACPGCGHEGHERDAKYCRKCGTWLDEETRDPRLKDDTDGASQEGH